MKAAILSLEVQQSQNRPQTRVQNAGIPPPTRNHENPRLEVCRESREGDFEKT